MVVSVCNRLTSTCKSTMVPTAAPDCPRKDLSARRVHQGTLAVRSNWLKKVSRLFYRRRSHRNQRRLCMNEPRCAPPKRMKIGTSMNGSTTIWLLDSTTFIFLMTMTTILTPIRSSGNSSLPIIPMSTLFLSITWPMLQRWTMKL